MSFNWMPVLICAQIGIDIALIIIFISVFRRMRYPEKALNKGIQLFESLLVDADATTRKFKEGLEEKQRLIRDLNEKLDKRILSLNVLFNRSEMLLSQNRRKEQQQTDNSAQNSVKEEILAFAKQGYGADYIAKSLSIPKEEVRLVLDMEKKTVQHER
jgi:uncharacterized protein YoxC